MLCYIFANTFFYVTFYKNFFNEFEINVKFCVFDTFFDLKKKKCFLGHVSTFKKNGKPFFKNMS
jgi:hypothetical protein